MNKSLKWQKISLSILCGFLALVLIVLSFATTYVHYLLNQLNRVDPDLDETLPPDVLATATESLDPNYTGETVHPSDITIQTVAPTVPSQGQNDTQNPNQGSQTSDPQIINILLVGQDRREGEPRQRSDSMILCTFNLATETLTLTSFLRDSYVYIPGYGNNKLNYAYLAGGFSKLNETLAVNFGVHVDANFEVDFSRFAEVIDLLGGVDINLTAAEADYLNTYGLGDHNEQWNLSAGTRHLNGKQALCYSRIRYVATANGTQFDFGRTERQRAVLTELINTYKNKSLTQMIALVDDLLPMVTTNMTNNEILSYMGTLFPMLANATIKTQSIPAEGTYTDQYLSTLGSILVLDLPTIRSQLNELFETN